MGAPGPGSARRPRGNRRQQQPPPPPAKQRAAPLPARRGDEKANRKPERLDEQEIPFRLREIMRSRQEMKRPLSSKSRKAQAQAACRRSAEAAKGAEPDIAVPQFKRRKRESERAYVRRMAQEARHVLFLTQNQAPRQPEAQTAPREKSAGKKAFQKRKLDRIQRRREEKAAERLEQELLRDPVQFGEVALQPPELTAKPRTSTSRDQAGRGSLALAGLLSPGRGARPQSASLARQRILGEERARAVQAYRALRQRRTLSLGSLPTGKAQGTQL